VTHNTAGQALDVLRGYCTLIYLFVTGWGKLYEECGKDVIAEIVPSTVEALRAMRAMRAMRKNVAPSTIPTMAAMLTAAGMGASPDRWRGQFGE
jgi:hypothetical protein